MVNGKINKMEMEMMVNHDGDEDDGDAMGQFTFFCTATCTVHVDLPSSKYSGNNII